MLLPVVVVAPLLHTVGLSAAKLAAEGASCKGLSCLRSPSAPLAGRGAMEVTTGGQDPRSESGRRRARARNPQFWSPLGIVEVEVIEFRFALGHVVVLLHVFADNLPGLGHVDITRAEGARGQELQKSEITNLNEDKEGNRAQGESRRDGTGAANRELCSNPTRRV